MARMKLTLGLAVVLGLSSCISTGRFNELPQADRDRMVRCHSQIQASRCGADHDAMYVEMCIRKAHAEYAEYQTPAERKTFLVANGCPPSMVSPEKYVDNDAPPPVQQPQVSK